MKLFFAGSIRGGGRYVKVYRRIIALLKAHGEVISEHFSDDNPPERDEKRSDASIYAGDAETISNADMLIAEVSHPSIGVGYEIGFAESLGKPIIALYHRESAHRISAMIAGNRMVVTLPYDTFEELSSLLDKHLKEGFHGRRKHQPLPDATLRADSCISAKNERG